MSNQQEDVLAAIQRIIETRTDYRGKVSLESDLIKDLELDSVSRTLVLVALEDHYSISLEGDLLLDIRTVGQLVDLVQAQQSKK